LPEIRAAIEAIDEQRELAGAPRPLAALRPGKGRRRSGVDGTPRLANRSHWSELPGAVVPPICSGGGADHFLPSRVEGFEGRRQHDSSVGSGRSYYPSINLAGHARGSPCCRSRTILLEAGKPPEYEPSSGPAVRLRSSMRDRLRANYKEQGGAMWTGASSVGPTTRRFARGTACETDRCTVLRCDPW
jgi:hypothetical protein